jgi:hypothetical protein
MSWSILTHNGTITAKNRERGTHRTFQVRKQHKDANFMPGERLVGLLTGPNNNADFRSFGFVDRDRVVLWKKHLDDPFFKWTAAFLLDPQAYADKVELLIEGRCRRCNRKLTTPESIESGIGPVCGGREPI